jgi:hypothetical protein
MIINFIVNLKGKITPFVIIQIAKGRSVDKKYNMQVGILKKAFSYNL